MILGPGRWQGRGSFRPTDASLNLRFEATVDIEDDRRTEGLVVNATLQVADAAQVQDGSRRYQVYIVADDVGTYAVTVTGEGVDVQGTAKLDSEPHLALLWSAEDDVHITSTVFTLPDTRGVRGFAKVRGDTWTWELALQPVGRHRRERPKPRAATGKAAHGNVVSLFDRLKR